MRVFLVLLFLALLILALLFFRAGANDTRYSPPRMSPASLLLYFAAGSTWCHSHLDTLLVCTDQRLLRITLTLAVCSAQRNKGGGARSAPGDIRGAEHAVGVGAP